MYLCVRASALVLMGVRVSACECVCVGVRACECMWVFLHVLLEVSRE